MRRSFTIIELMLVIGIIGTLSGIVIGAINPGVQLTSAKDATRRATIRELQNAVIQYVIDTGATPDVTHVLPDQQWRSINICRDGVSDTYCYNLSALVPAYLAAIPQDSSEPETSNTSGYSIYEINGQARVTSRHFGSGDTGGPGDYSSRLSLEEGTGSTSDDEVQAVDGSISGATWSTETPSQLDSSYSLEFDGSNDHIYPDSPDPGDYHDLFTEKSISMWVTIDADPSSEPANIFEEGGSTHGMGILYYSGTNDIAYGTTISSVDAEIRSTSTFTPADTNWIHIGTVYDNGTMYLYINGVLEATGTNSTNVPAHSGQPGIGESPDGTYVSAYDFNGKVDDFRMYMRALTSQEMAALAAGR